MQLPRRKLPRLKKRPRKAKTDLHKKQGYLKFNLKGMFTVVKQKSHKATAKRFSVTKGGKVKYNQSNRRHKLGLKTPKRKRQLRGGAILSESFAPTIKKLIPYA